MTCDVCGVPFDIEYIEPSPLTGIVGMSQFSKTLITIDNSLPENLKQRIH